MTVLQLISSQGYYGMENMLVSLSSGLERLGVSPLTGVFDDAREPHTEICLPAQQLGLQVEKIPCSGRLDVRAVKRIRRLISTYPIDVIHAHGYKADMYAWLARSGRHPALVATSHNWPDRHFKMRAYAVLDRFLLRHFDAVAVVSEAVARKLDRAGVKKNLTLTIPNGVDIERLQNAAPTLRRTSGESLIGCVGRAIPAKGGREFLQAARVVLTRFPRARFVWIGDGPSLSEWKALALRMGVSANVDFTGARSDMPGIYASLDMLALPSLEEAMPMCLLEATAAGLPVVASEVGAVPQVVQHEVSGLLVPPGDVSALAAGLIRLLDDPALATRFGVAGRARAAAEFSLENMARRYLGLYADVLKRGAS